MPCLVELGVFNEVTTFTTSDFGRTLTSNGKGSDHGWGGHHIVMGGSVNGGSIYGDYPILSATNPLDVGRGVYAPTTSVDEYFAELARWVWCCACRSRPGVAERPQLLLTGKRPGAAGLSVSLMAADESRGDHEWSFRC